LTIDGREVFLCCTGCKKSALADPQKTLAGAAALVAQNAQRVPAAPTPAPAQVDEEAAIEAELARLSPKDRRLATSQKYCVVMPDSRLGSMGPPQKITLNNGQVVFVCCEGCQEEALANPEKVLVQLRALAAKARSQDAIPAKAAEEESDDDEVAISAGLAKLSAEDRKTAMAQKYCVVLQDNRLGSMGKPVKLTLDGQEVFVCCSACKSKALADPKAALAAAAKFKQQTAK
jgi:hypothetical protein